jgi:phage tail sheath gpL-like
MQISAFEHHVRLITDKELDSDMIRQYYKIVQRHFDDIIEPDEDDNVLVYHVNAKGNHCYDIRLEEDLDLDEGDIMSQEISALIPEDIEMQIEATSDTDIEAEIEEHTDNLADDDFSAIANDVARYKHNRWMEHYVGQGWRYGQKLDEREKTHPALRPWDELPEAVRKVDNEFPKTIVEYLNQRGYGIYKR